MIRTLIRPTVGNQPSFTAKMYLRMIARKKIGIEMPSSETTRLDVVERPAVALRGEEAERDPEQDREEHRRDRELDRRREALLDLLERPAAAT